MHLYSQTEIIRKGHTRRKQAVNPIALKIHAAPFEPDQARDPPKQAVQQRQASIEMTALQSKFINDTMKNIREREVENRAAAKRQRTQKNQSAPSHLCNESSIINRSSNWTSIFLDRLSWNPNVAQVVATSGGLVTYWNEAFSGITRSSSSLRKFPITMFELIDSKSLPSLYSMLALALHDISIVEDTASSQDETSFVSSHLSITLPCKSFGDDSSSSYDITIIYMDDLSSRCFVGILTPSPQIKTRNIKRCDSSLSCSDSSQCGGQISSSDSAEDSHEETTDDYEAFETLPTGRVLRLSDDHLCRMIFGPKLRSS